MITGGRGPAAGGGNGGGAFPSRAVGAPNLAATIPKHGQLCKDGVADGIAVAE